MRTGIIIAALLHIVLIGFAIFSLKGARMDEVAMQTQPLPVALVPLEEEMALSQGDPQHMPDNKPAPKPTSKPAEREEAQHVGDGNIDTNAPLKPQERPREVEVAAERSRTDNPREADAKPVDVTSQDATPNLEQAVVPEAPKPQEQAQEQQAQETARSQQEELPQEAKTSVEASAVTPQASLPSLPDAAPAPRQKPKPPAKPAQSSQPSQTAQANQPGEQARPTPPSSPPAPPSGDSLEDILAENAALLDRTRTQGGGARRAEDDASFGSRNSNNDDHRLAQTISNVIGGCIQRNWRLASISGSSAYDLAVKMHVMFRADGNIDGEPELTPTGGDAGQREIITYQALSALRKCAPFELPADQYNKWRDVTINMKAFPG